MFDLASFTLSNMIDCTAAVRGLGRGANSMEQAAERITRYLYDNLIDEKTGAKACALVRLYKTHPYGALDQELAAFASGLLASQAPAPAAHPASPVQQLH